jgi:hypothetical protein
MDETEGIRRLLVGTINQSVLSDSIDSEKTRLIKIYGKEDVFTTDEIREKYIVRSFLAPFVFVTDKKTNQNGTLSFQHQPRLYFDFRLEDGSKPNKEIKK